MGRNRGLIVTSRVSWDDNLWLHSLTNELTEDTERYLISYHDNEEDLMANAFAGRFLMPDDMFCQTYHMALKAYVRHEGNETLSESDKYACITISLMIIFETTYMSVVVRMYELGLLPKDDQMLMETLLKYNDEKALRSIIEKVPNLKGSAVKLYYPEMVNDFGQMYALAKTNGEKSVQSEIMDKSYMEYNLDLLQKMYQKVADVGNEVTQHDIC